MNSLPAAITVRDRIVRELGLADFLELLDAEVWFAREAGSPLSMVMFDLDGFGAVEAALGRPAAGDVLGVALRRLASRHPWSTTRWTAGDELAWVLPGITLPDAHRMTEAAARRLSARRIEPWGVVHATFGVAAFVAWMREGWDLMGASASALQRAKRARR